MGYNSMIFNGESTDIIAGALYLIVFVILTAAAIIDIRKRIIPDKLVLSGSAAGLILKIFDTKNGFLDGLIGGMAAGLVLLIVYHITKGGIGLGDVKLFGCIGIYLGFENAFSALFLACILSGLLSLVLICMNMNNRKREMPFAPFVLAGALVAVIFGEVL